MRLPSLAALAALFLSTVAAAQVPLLPMGTYFNTGLTWLDRGGLLTATNLFPCTLFTRHDKEHYAGWTNVPNMREVHGAIFVLADVNWSTPDPFGLVIYKGDPAQVDMPDVTAPLASPGLGSLPPLSFPAYYAVEVIMTLNTPVLAPASEDVYIGIELGTGLAVDSQGYPTDGQYLATIESQVQGFPYFSGQSQDLPGISFPATFPSNTFAGYYCTTPSIVGPGYLPMAQYLIQPLVKIAGGVASTLTNQTHHVASTATGGYELPGAGTSCMFSGLYPDAANPPVNAGRADDFGQIFYHPNVANGLVFFLADLGLAGSNPEFAFGGFFAPGSTFALNSTGVTCLNLGRMQVLGFKVADANGWAANLMTFPPGARFLMPGINWLQQAVGFDSVRGAIHGTACTRQRT